MDVWANLSKASFLADSDTWILASSSPRRIQLCNSMGWKPIVMPSNFGEDYDHKDFQNPAEYALETARGKVMDVYHEILSGISPRSKISPKVRYIVGADTIVTEDGHRILEKPKSKQDALSMLELLSGRWHQCITGVVILELPTLSKDKSDCRIWTFHQRTDVELETIDSDFLNSYLKYSDECMDKAGACAYQGLVALYTKGIKGDYYNSLGFPLSLFFKWVNDH